MSVALVHMHRLVPYSIIATTSCYVDPPARLASHLLSRSLFGIPAFPISVGAAMSVAALSQITLKLE
jgi:hypothetical protein